MADTIACRCRTSDFEITRLVVVITVVSIYFSFPILILSPNYPQGVSVHVLQLAGAAWGVFCSLIVFFSAWRVPRYRRHPNKLMLWRTLCDMGIGLSILVVQIFVSVRCDRSPDDCNAVCQSRKYCQLCLEDESPAFVQNFFFIAAECWSLVQALDLFYSVKNPFYSFRSRMKLYHLGTWAFAMFDSVLPFIIKSAAGTDPKIYGFMEGRGLQLGDGGHTCDVEQITDSNELQLNAMCWIRNRYDNVFLPRSWRDLSVPLYFWMPMSFFLVAVLFLLYKAYRRLNEGLSGTFAARRRVFAVNFTQSFVFLAWWGIYVMLDWIPLGTPHDISRIMYAVRSYMIASKGCIDLIAWTFSNDPKLLTVNRNEKHQRDYDRDLEPQVNETLRKEILHYITSSIRMAIRNSNKSQDHDDLRRGANSHDGVSMQQSGAFFPPILIPSISDVGKWDEDREEALMYVLKPWKKARNLEKMGFLQLLEVAMKDIDETPSTFATRTTSATVASEVSQHTTVQKCTPPINAASPPTPPPDIRPSTSDEEVHEEDEEEQDVFSSSDLDQLAEHRRSRSENHSVSSETWTPFVPETWDEEANENKGMLKTSLLFADYVRDPPRDGALSPTRRSLASQSLSGTPKNEREVRFLDHEPSLFKRIRDHFKIDSEKYIDSFRSTAKERLTEGGSSGAFFFYSGCERFMVKSCSLEEFKALLDLLPDYTEYICSHQSKQQSFLVRLYGAYTLQLYETDFRFFVMENLFHMEDGEVIQQRFDIKGSTVSRNMAPPKKGQQLTCRHCNQKYTWLGSRNLQRLQPTAYSSQGLFCMFNRDARQASILSRPSVRMERSQSQRASWTDTFARVFYHGDNQQWASRSTIPSPTQRAWTGKGPVEESVGGGADKSLLPNDQLAGSRAVDGTNSGSGSISAMRNEQQCPLRVRGKGHEPNLVLKDNDLTFKLRFSPLEAPKVAEQLKNDSALLARHGIMDYSLLLGIRVVEYEVKLVDQARHQQALSPVPSKIIEQQQPSPPPPPPPPPPQQQHPRIVPHESGMPHYPAQPPPPSAMLGERIASIDSSRCTEDASHVPEATESYPQAEIDLDQAYSYGTPRLQPHRALSTAPSMDLSELSGGAEEGSPRRPVRRARLEKRRSTVFDAAGNKDVADQNPSGSRSGRDMPVQSPARRVRDYSPEEESSRQVVQNCRESHVVQRTEYYLGIIDILQKWNWKKKFERFWKVRILGNDGDGVSCVCPTIYHHRFIDKVDDIVQLERVD